MDVSVSVTDAQFNFSEVESKKRKDITRKYTNRRRGIGRRKWQYLV